MWGSSEWQMKVDGNGCLMEVGPIHKAINAIMRQGQIIGK
jgi:hypothetical protein